MPLPSLPSAESAADNTPQFGNPAQPWNTGDGGDNIGMERRLRALNSARQKEMVADTNKLLKLAKALNDEVAAAGTGTLTEDQIRKIAEIEKLARNIKERMVNGAGPPPLQPPILPPIQAPIQAPILFPAN
ncbi:MAG: hypothetical protein ACLQG3_13655 [Terracidiphilus sp.]